MASKLFSALAATALIAAVPSIAVAQYDEGEGDGIQTEVALGVIFALVAAVILLWDDEGDPISP